ncbi:MAG: 2-oxoglutarate dehydrogenase E1 component [Gammaproteobacteria bacterium]|nr:2-oxoglutarate dehydrogenase E1 component [Gammaproteobacteria bacterium]NNJ50732.1 2-oxoglutarate dehydrogenase E1 component [Gammaproteobacteria bacterium]
MTKTGMSELWENSAVYGESAAWLESMYETYLSDPDKLETRWRQYFDDLHASAKSNRSSAGGRLDNGFKVASASREISPREVHDYFVNYARHKHARGFEVQTDYDHEKKQVHVLQLINAYRFRGHQVAQINPLGRRREAVVEELSLKFHGLSDNDLDTEFETGSFGSAECLPLREIQELLEQTYCGTIGSEYMHILETKEKRWIQKRLESSRSMARLNDVEKINILQQLTDAEGLERYLHSKYVGQKRFSLEGGESLIPLLDELVQFAGTIKIKEVVIGMAHRGRLNVLVNVLGKTPDVLFSEFEGTKQSTEITGDVKYHLGYASDMETPGGPVHLALAFNPSHLEIVAPVVEGAVRARQWRRGDREGREVIPVQIHGDAAFSAQGVVMETLQMSQSRGYLTHGTVHIIVNNQIGFTTSAQQDARSTYYSTDIAKMVGAPIFHVNGDDPEAVVMVTRLALQYRKKFKKDVVIDIMCYRRHGHNEADEPSATQPMMYRKIRALETTREIYAKKIVQEKVLTQEQCDTMAHSVRKILESGTCVVPHKLPESLADQSTHVKWEKYLSDSILADVDTTVEISVIREVGGVFESLPENFQLHPRVEKIVADRIKMTAGALSIDWGYAELMAYGTLLKDGFSVRLSGQDSGRGTFFHRHAVLHNQLDGSSYDPLRELGNDSANFRVFDSLLSEVAVLGFEYGFSTTEPETLVLWEAQFGDFANGAQVVIDQFISAGEHKWGRASGLVMLLPHGYEGQGAEHSSARLERYLQLCAVHNMQVCVPSTPAQMFHLLRRQMVRNCRKPLIIMTPKSLLRHKLCVSTLEDLTHGGFNLVLPEVDELDEKVRRVIICSGKIYYELLEARRVNRIHDIAILRVEQIYPFPGPQLDALLEQYTDTDNLVWCQEEPKNQGAWDFCKVRIPALIDQRWQLAYAGRQPSSAPAVGSAKLHAQEQQQIINTALDISED